MAGTGGKGGKAGTGGKGGQGWLYAFGYNSIIT